MPETLTPDQVLDAVGEWSLLQINDFVKKFEEKFDVSAAAAPMAMMPGMMPGAPAEAVEEQTEFTVVLTGSGANKIKVIKEVRALVPELGLKEAKDLVDGAPKEILKDVTKEQAEAAKKQLEEAGGTAEIK
jgi:large subunit ribosomal protein L7/L12